MTSLLLAAALAAAPAPADLFAPIAAVLQSPRCRNCHPAGDAPKVGDANTPHRMAISRRSPEVGLACHSCHRDTNAPAKNAPPGVPNWHMPSREMPMVFDGLSPGALCAQLLDPKRNGGKTREALRHHLAEDPLVLWAWNPGEGRTLPPITHQDLMTAVEAWLAAGTPCPAP